MITFKCRSCGHGLRVPDTGAGRKGRCPKCSTVVRVPQLAPKPVDVHSLLDMPVGGGGELRLKQEPSCASASDGVPPWATDYVAETLQRDEPQGNQGQRKHPWPIDCLLYPANVPGLINLLVFWLLTPVVAFFCQFIIIPFLGFVISLVVPAFMIYYFSDCIRDSAKGNTRAPDNIGDPPSLREAFAQFLCLVATMTMALLPTGIALVYYWRFNGVVWTGFALGVFLLPMALLATTMRDTGAGLNPLVWILAIVRTLIPYLGLAGIFLALNLAVVFVVRAADALHVHPILIMGPLIYGYMVLMHLVGRFYYRYEERLNW